MPKYTMIVAGNAIWCCRSPMSLEEWKEFTGEDNVKPVRQYTKFDQRKPGWNPTNPFSKRKKKPKEWA